MGQHGQVLCCYLKKTLSKGLPDIIVSSSGITKPGESEALHSELHYSLERKAFSGIAAFDIRSDETSTTAASKEPGSVESAYVLRTYDCTVLILPHRAPPYL